MATVCRRYYLVERRPWVLLNQDVMPHQLEAGGIRSLQVVLARGNQQPLQTLLQCSVQLLSLSQKVGCDPPPGWVGG